MLENPAVAAVKIYQPKPMVKLDPSFDVNTETFADDVTVLLDIELKKDAPGGRCRTHRYGALSVLQRHAVPAAKTQAGYGDHHH